MRELFSFVALVFIFGACSTPLSESTDSGAIHDIGEAAADQTVVNDGHPPAADQGIHDSVFLPNVDAPLQQATDAAPVDAVPLDSVAPDTAVAGDTIAWPTQSCGLQEGDNTNFMIAGASRRFFIELENVPAGYSGKLPVVFAYHGLGSSAYSMNNWTSPVKANAPFIKVVPQSLHASTDPVWDFQSDPTQSIDLDFFDAMLGCLNAQYDIDLNRIHALGFSYGGHWVDYLLTHRGNILASFAQVSGGFFSFSTSSPLYFYWPADTLLGGLTNRAAGITAWGGASDGSNGLFDTLGKNSVQLLRSHNHFVVQCVHDKGHKWPPGGFAKFIFQFFQDHPLGTSPSPYQTGLPQTTPFTGTYKDWPSWCSVAP
jgi:hypothetical protein